jgi:hypothetical protein
MSLSVNTSINRALPVPENRQSPVIKRSENASQEAVKTGFSSLMNTVADASPQDVVTGEEKQFFAEMFPSSTEEIRTYSGYSPGGMKRPVQLGTLIDMKG